MNEARKNNLRMVKIFYTAVNAFLIGTLILSFAFFSKIKISLIAVLVFDLFVVFALFLVDYEVYEFGIESIANCSLTKKLLSVDHQTEVIPVNPSDDINFIASKYETASFVDGNIHNELVNATDKSKFYAKLELNPYTERVAISRSDDNGEKIYFVGYIRIDYFPYFYEMSKKV